MIGTYEEATRALRNDLPMVGTGSSRLAYLSGDVVYKVACGFDGYENELEWENYQKIVQLDIPEPIAIPATYLWRIQGKPVIAMQYIDGQVMGECWCDYPREPHTAACMPTEITGIVSKYISDAAGMNVVFDGDSYWIIDMEM